MRDDPSVVALVTRAARSDQGAWNEIVDRYAPLVWAICARFGLNSQDREDVGQSVWLLLVEQLGKLREPAALPGWLATTTHRECLRVLESARKSERLGSQLDDAVQFVDDTVIEEEILMAELNASLRAAFAELPPRCQHLLGLLMSDPPTPYADISTRIGIPVGSIGPQRARCLDRMRRSPPWPGWAETASRSTFREASQVRDWDDEQLLAALRAAMKARQGVPDRFVEMGKNAYAWHNIDAELAQLTYDSRSDAGQAAALSGAFGGRVDPGAHLHLGAAVHRARGHRGLAAGPGHPAAGRDARDPYRRRRDHHAGGRDRLFRGRAHPGQPVPAALPHDGRG